MARRRGQLVSDTTETTTASAAGGSFDEEVAKDLLERARREGVSLVGPGGLLAGLTKTVLETALEAELTDHLGYEKHDPAGRNGANSRNGARSKQVITEVGPVEVDVPRDREGTFEPRIVPKRARRLGGVDELVISLVAKGLTTGEVQAHLAEVYGADVSRETISKITDAGPRADGGVAVPAPGAGLPGVVHRRDLREGPRRPGRQPADLRGHRRHRGRRTRHPRLVGRHRAARAPSTGCRSSPRSRTAASRTSASSSATA